MGNEQYQQHIKQKPQRNRAHLFMPVKAYRLTTDSSINPINSKNSGNSRQLSLNGNTHHQKSHGPQSRGKHRQYLSLSKQELSSTSNYKGSKENKKIALVSSQAKTQDKRVKRPSIEKLVLSQSHSHLNQVQQNFQNIVRPRDLPRPSSQQSMHHGKLSYALPVPCHQQVVKTQNPHHSMPLAPKIVVTSPPVQSKENLKRVPPCKESNFSKTFTYLSPTTVTDQSGEHKKLKKVALSRSYVEESPVKGYSFDHQEQVLSPSSPANPPKTQKQAESTACTEKQDQNSIFSSLEHKVNTGLFTDPKLMAYITSPTKTSLFSQKDGKFALAFAKDTCPQTEYSPQKQEQPRTEGAYLDSIGGTETISETLIEQTSYHFPTLTNFSSASNNTSFQPIPSPSRCSKSAKVIQQCRPTIDPSIMADLLKIS